MDIALDVTSRWRSRALLIVACLGVAGCESGDVGSITLPKSAAKGAPGGAEEGVPPPAKAARKSAGDADLKARESLPKAAQRKG